jgi:hypothetical protein
MAHRRHVILLCICASRWRTYHVTVRTDGFHSCPCVVVLCDPRVPPHGHIHRHAISCCIGQPENAHHLITPIALVLPLSSYGCIRVLYRTTTEQTSTATFMAPRHSHHRQSTFSLHHDLAWGASLTSTTTASQRGRLRFAVASGGGCGALRAAFSERNQVYHQLER